MFWYPKTPTKQLSSRAGAKSSSKAAKQHSKVAKQHSSKVPSQQLSSQAGAKMPRYHDFFPRAKHFVHFPGIPWFGGNP